VGFSLIKPEQFYYVILAGCLLAAFVSWRLSESRLGRQWMALREDEDVAEAMGIQLVGTKLLAFAIGAAFSGLAGALFASKLTSIFPHSFKLEISINVLVLIIIGGMGSLLGALLGAVFVTLFPYLIEAALQKLPDAQSYAGVLFAVNYAAFGAVMILFLLFEPLGLVGIWHRVQTYFLLWPFKYRPIAGAGK